MMYEYKKEARSTTSYSMEKEIDFWKDVRGDFQFTEN